MTKAGNKFMLEDQDAKVSYNLDDAGKATQYEGKEVSVTGTLDPQNHTIHVRSIRAGS